MSNKIRNFVITSRTSDSQASTESVHLTGEAWLLATARFGLCILLSLGLLIAPVCSLSQAFSSCGSAMARQKKQKSSAAVKHNNNHKTNRNSRSARPGNGARAGRRAHSSSRANRHSARKHSINRRSANRHVTNYPVSRHGRHTAHKTHVGHAAHAATHHVVRAQPHGQDFGPVDIGIGPRARNYALLSRSYSLYDQGVNERIRGNYGAATEKLAEAVSLMDQTRSNQRDGATSTLQAMTFYELGLAAEGDGDFTLARDSYAHCLRAKADYVEAYLHIVSMLAGQGQLPLAMTWLKEGARACPHDARINQLSTQLSTFMGRDGSTSENTEAAVPETAPEAAETPAIPAD